LFDLDKEVRVTESENTSASASPPSGGESAPARKRTGRPRRKPGTAARRKTSTGGKKATGHRTTSTTPRKGPATRRRRRSPKATGIEAILNDLAKRANQAGSKISDLSEEGTAAARRTLGKITASSKRTITRVKREWDRMDNTRKLEFAAGLLAALAAATAVRKAARK
jgi:hypothetical protein